MTGHAPFVEASRHDDLVIDRRLWEHYEAPTDPVALAMEDRMDEALPMMADQPHDRVRGLLGKAFTLRAVAGLEPSIRSILGELIDGIRPKGRFDLVADLANWYPVRVISRMFGIQPNSEREALFNQYADVFVRSVNPFLPAEERARSARVQAKFLELVSEVVEEHRANPRDDLLSALISAEEDGDRLSTSELMNLMLGLIMAGTETTASAVAIGMFDLLRNPDQVAVFREDPSVRANAVLELLRLGAGLQIERFARRDLEIGGVPIRKGQMVVGSMYAAHHDPTVFPDPKRLDLRRDLKELAVFGGGRHFCLGTQLAKLELETAYSTLIDGLPGLRLAVPETEVEITCDNRRTVVSLPLEFDEA
ncbi:MAG: cytochrome P450 [Myxococcales bacterium]|nr:cytochrome P450 [Myxococcales bacterium]